MSIKKKVIGWQVDSQPGGRGAKRFRKSFDTQAEAKRYEAWLKSQINQNADWQPEKRDQRELSELVALWYEHHGIGLKAGQETLRSLNALCKALGNPIAGEFKAELFTRYRTQRLESGTSANSLNHEHAYLRSVFNELARLGLWKRENPLKLLRPFKLEERELSFLTLEQVQTLLEALDRSKNLHLGLIARVCLSTGARWGEAEELRIAQIKNGLIQYARTKSGRVRAVPITKELDELLKRHHKQHGTGERLFTSSRSAFAVALARTNLKLEDGQMTHVLRHTFASHFIMQTNDILSLQKVLGHSDLKMTMRYAHLAKGHLDKVTINNPLTLLTVG